MKCKHNWRFSRTARIRIYEAPKKGGWFKFFLWEMFTSNVTVWRDVYYCTKCLKERVK